MFAKLLKFHLGQGSRYVIEHNLNFFFNQFFLPLQKLKKLKQA